MTDPVASYWREHPGGSLRRHQAWTKEGRIEVHTGPAVLCPICNPSKVR